LRELGEINSSDSALADGTEGHVEEQSRHLIKLSKSFSQKYFLLLRDLLYELAHEIS
jgi:hypothetical protein